MQTKMQYLCPTKGIGSIDGAFVTPPGPRLARLGNLQGSRSNGIVDMRAYAYCATET